MGSLDVLRQLKLIRKEAKRIADFYDNIQMGSGATDAAGDATVTFPGGFVFSSTPKVFLQGVDAAAKGIVLDVVSKTVAGFTVKARKVTGINSGGAVGSIDPAVGGSAYTWGLADPGHTHTNPNTSSVGGHTHSIGSPSTGSFVYSGTDPGHTHTGTTDNDNSATLWGWLIGAYDTLYAASVSGGSPTTHFYATDAFMGHQQYLYGHHTHTFTTGSSTTGITLNTSPAVTGIPSSTGSAGGHSHTQGSTGNSHIGVTLQIEYHYHTSTAPVLSVNFDFLAILP